MTRVNCHESRAPPEIRSRAKSKVPIEISPSLLHRLNSCRVSIKADWAGARMPLVSIAAITTIHLFMGTAPMGGTAGLSRRATLGTLRLEGELPAGGRDPIIRKW